MFIGNIGADTEKYLYDNGITKLDDLVGSTVYLAYPSQGIVCFKVKKIEFSHKQKEWFFTFTHNSYRVSELGKRVFFAEEEARVWQMNRLEEYTEDQKKRILRRESERKQKEIKELNSLLEKYPDENSRKVPDKCCGTCAYNVKPMVPHTCDECTSLDQDEMYSMWEWNCKDF